MWCPRRQMGIESLKILLQFKTSKILLPTHPQPSSSSFQNTDTHTDKSLHNLCVSTDTFTAKVTVKLVRQVTSKVWEAERVEGLAHRERNNCTENETGRKWPVEKGLSAIVKQEQWRVFPSKQAKTNGIGFFPATTLLQVWRKTQKLKTYNRQPAAQEDAHTI